MQNVTEKYCPWVFLLAGQLPWLNGLQLHKMYTTLVSHHDVTTFKFDGMVQDMKNHGALGVLWAPWKMSPHKPFPQTFSTSKTLSVLVDLDQYINLIVRIHILLPLSPRLIPKKFKIQNQNTNFYFSKNVQLKLSRNHLKKKFKKVPFNRLF